MQYTRLGTTGLEVSRICLGCMSYGEPSQGTHPWSLDEQASRPFFVQALDAGINFFDTAEMYAVPASAETSGRTEEIIGQWFARTGNRDKVVLATKDTIKKQIEYYLSDRNLKSEQC